LAHFARRKQHRLRFELPDARIYFVRRLISSVWDFTHCTSRVGRERDCLSVAGTYLKWDGDSEQCAGSTIVPYQRRDYKDRGAFPLLMPILLLLSLAAMVF